MTIEPKLQPDYLLADLARLTEDGLSHVEAGVVTKLLSHIAALTADRDHWVEARRITQEAGEQLKAELDKLRAMERRLEEPTATLESQPKDWPPIPRDAIATSLCNVLKGPQ